MAESRKAFQPMKWLSSKTIKLYLSFHGKSSLSSPKSVLSSQADTSRSNHSSTSSYGRDPSEELKDVFRYFDGDGDGKVSAYELRSYFASVGEYVSHENAQALVDAIDKDGDGVLGFDDFLRMVTTEGDHNHGGNEVEDLKMAFEMFEYEKGSGCITPAGLQNMLNKLGDPRSLDECAAIIEVYDIDGNGVLDFHEFHQMMVA